LVPWWWFQTTRSLRHSCKDAVFQAIGPWHETCLGSESLDTLYGNPEHLARRVAEITEST
jgi:hypothetical protein